MRTEAQSTSKEGLPYGNLLTQLIMDAGVDEKRYELTSMQLDIINNGTYRLLMAHGSGSQHPLSILQHLGGMTRALLEMEHIILHAVETAIAHIINSLVAMEKKLEKIGSMQLELKKTNGEGWKDIMQRIADVEGDVLQELEGMTL
ncbi:hypothetical protein CJ030_MR5G001850 [Morella rubra]|uniref:Uncharacterized protein n=1 Tax=Morella rubra TaxID=262757 RepID=A0A6A1VMB4_9ROSI|nr:hypothetical protein CJ030_MR5G001850 [Morella rubra]